MKTNSEKETRRGFREKVKKFFADLKKDSVSQYQGKPFDCCNVPDNHKANRGK